MFVLFILSAITNAGETRSRKWYQLSGTRNLHVCRSVCYQFFSGTGFWYGIEHSSITSQKLSGTWHKPCNVIGWRVVLVMNVRQMFQVSGASFWSMCRRHNHIDLLTVDIIKLWYGVSDWVLNVSVFCSNESASAASWFRVTELTDERPRCGLWIRAADTRPWCKLPPWYHYSQELSSGQMHVQTYIEIQSNIEIEDISCGTL